jgi:hypothetical protein
LGIVVKSGIEVERGWREWPDAVWAVGCRTFAEGVEFGQKTATVRAVLNECSGRAE